MVVEGTVGPTPQVSGRRKAFEKGSEAMPTEESSKAGEASAEVAGSASSRFFDHLDICDQCRNNPMGLCAIGDNLLRAVAQHTNGKLCCGSFGAHYPWCPLASPREYPR